MRTIEEIKETICADFMRNESVAELFGFTPGDSFTSHFSKVSVIGILFYIFAVAAWTLEKLFDTYKGEVDTRIEEIIPHRPRWYRDKVLAFMKGKTLIADTDRYDTEGMTEDAIAAARAVKHAVAVENRDASLLTIKVAGEKDGKRCRLDAETEAQLAAYIAEILRGAIQAIPPGEIEAARALGMSKAKALIYIILPRAARIGLPAYSNEVILMLKASALASTVTLLELTGMARTIIARTYLPVEIFFAAGMFYLLMAYVLVRGFKLLERWLRVDACQGR